MTEILQRSIPFDPRDPRPLPGIAPLDPADWLRIDDAYAGQMAERVRLLADHRAAVLALDARGRAAAEELLETVLAFLDRQPDFSVSTQQVICPDGRKVALDRTDPLGTIGQLVQQDFCILEKDANAEEHVMTGAVLCFPASWSLDEKFMKPLIGIHEVVDEYDGNLARRVQRLFDGIQPGRPLWRNNALWYADPALHQPRRENDGRDERGATEADFMRAELQTLVRLPRSRAVVFGIHTYLLSGAQLGQAVQNGAGTT